MQIDPYCGAAPAPQDLLLRWNTDPVLMCALGGLAFVLWRYRRSGTGARDAVLLLILLVVAFVSPLCALSSALFSARALHHVILISLAAPLAALLLPQNNRLLDRIPASASFLGHTVILWAWHLPGPYAFALSSSAAYWIMEVPLLVTAVLLWRDILHPRRIGAGLGACAGTLLQMSLLGAILTFASAPMFEAHFLTTEAYGISALEDQQLAGLLMWVPASLIYVAAFLVRIRDLMAQAALGGALGGADATSGVR